MLLQRVNETLTSFALVFVCCEFGHKLSNAFEQIDNQIGELHWYGFPVQVWKMLPTLIAGAQKSCGLRVFGSASCTREEFKNVCIFFEKINSIDQKWSKFCDNINFEFYFQVINGGFSYFILLRQFEY